MNNLIIFVHIPRTGGSSLRVLLEKEYGRDAMLRVYGDNITSAPEYLASWFSLHPEDRDAIKVVHGHFCYGIHKAIADYDKPCSYITILRHPIRRVVSLYNYIRNSTGHRMHSEVSRMTLTKFISSGISLEVDNGQVRQLCGTEGELPQYGWGSMNTPHGKCTTGMLQQAKENLALQFVAGGVTEHFDNAINLIRRRLYLPSTNESPPHVNHSHGLNWRAITKDQRAVILEYNVLDAALWGYTRNLFGGVKWMWR